MADLYIRELEAKVAHYEKIMSTCPQCKTTLPASEPKSTTAPSRHSRSSRSAQQSAAEVNQPAVTGTSKQPVSTSALSSSARSSKQVQPTAKALLPAPTGPSRRPVPASTLSSTLSSAGPSSKQPRPTSRTELQTSGLQKSTPLIPPVPTISQSHQNTEARVSTLRHPNTNSPDLSATGSVTSAAADSSGQRTTSSNTLSTRPSSSRLSTAEERDHHSGKLIDIDLQQNKKQNKGGRPPGETPKRAAWKTTARIMIDEVPSGRLWKAHTMEMDSSIIAAVSISLAPGSKGNMSPAEDVERKDLIRLVRSFAERHSEGRLNFQHFVLVCLCQVLSSQGVPRDQVVETLQICISDTSKENIYRYLRGTTWANEVMNELFLTDWGYRAVTLIAIWNRTVATYGKIAVAPESRQYFVAELTQQKYFEGYQEVPGQRYETIPWIVKKELGDEVSYRDICEALGYSDEYFLKTKHLHSSNPPNPDSNPGDSDDTGSIPRSDSFHTARQSTISASSPQQPISAGETPSTYRSNASYVQDLSQPRRRALQGAGPDDAAGRDPPTSQNAASQRTNRMVPDRSAQPLGDPDVVDRRRRKRHEVPSSAGLPSTSLGESAVDTHSTKRPLPDSPTSASGPTDTPRRRQNLRERPSREKMGPSSHSGNKVSDNQKRRA